MRLVAALASMVCALLGATPAFAQDDVELMAEPTTYTDVIDAADVHDPFDINLSIGFLRTQTDGRIQRELASGTAHAGGDQYADVGKHRQVTNALIVGLDVGLYRDLMLYGRLPVVLSDDRQLRSPPSVALNDLPFGVPFRSPTRSGLDTVTAGLAWGITNQMRSPHLPTWVLMLEGRFNIGTTLRACGAENVGMATGPCRDTYAEDGSARYSDTAGLSRGTHTLRVETRASRRFGELEPYAGLGFQAEFLAGAQSTFLPAGDVDGVIQRHPPMRVDITTGLSWMPWEHQARFQRLTLDLRGQFSYFTEGRDYTPLFDALGTSQDAALTSPNYEVADPQNGPNTLRKSYNYGITDVQARARIGGMFNVEVRAARYIKLGFGVGVYYTTPYMLTFADACNASVTPDNDDRRQGTCRDGVINPNFRSSIDLPGRRFRLDQELTFDLNATVTAMF